MNALQVKVYGTLEYLFSLIKIVAIVGFLVLGSWILFFSRQASSMGLQLYTAHGGFFPFGVRGMWAAVVVAIFSYFGVEMVAVAAGKRAIRGWLSAAHFVPPESGWCFFIC